MGSRSLRDSRTVILDGSGNGTVTFGPDRNSWVIHTISVNVSSNADEPTANIYRGTPNPSSLLTGTYSGSHNTDSDVNDNPLYPGEVYTCQWLGGDPGATATVSFTGIEETRS